MRYALGPESYAAEGGVLPANSLGWDKSAEAVTANYDEKHGHETVTLLIYPTPQIAQAFEKQAVDGCDGLGAELCECEGAARSGAGDAGLGCVAGQ